MQKETCKNCKAEIDVLRKKCEACGFSIVLEPAVQKRARVLRAPSLGALFFTQGWTLGARLYVFFILSLVPVVGVAVLILSVIFGRRLSWKYGGWGSWEEFTSRMRLLDIIGVVWVAVLIVAYFTVRYYRL